MQLHKKWGIVKSFYFATRKEYLENLLGINVMVKISLILDEHDWKFCTACPILCWWEAFTDRQRWFYYSINKTGINLLSIY